MISVSTHLAISHEYLNLPRYWLKVACRKYQFTCVTFRQFDIDGVFI